MNDAPANVLNPETVLARIKKHGVTHVVYLPDSETNWLYLMMKADPAICLVGVNREGHASSIDRPLVSKRSSNVHHPLGTRQDEHRE